MMKLLLLLLLIPGTTEAITLGQLRDRANQVLGNFWTNDLLPAQQSYFNNNGKYYQCLTTGNVPNTRTTDATVNEIIGNRRNARIHDYPETCAEVIPRLDTQKPFILWVDVFESPTHHGFKVRVFTAHNGTVYTRMRCYGISKADNTEGIDEGCTDLSEDWRVALSNEDRNE